MAGWVPDDDYGGRYMPPLPPPPGGSGGGGGGGIPPVGGPPADDNQYYDYEWESDPTVIMAKALQSSGLAQLDAQLKALRERSIIQFGDPSLAGAAGFNLDPSAAEFARQNYASGISTKARLEKASKDRRRAIINRLASRGILRSGETGFQEGEESLLGAQENSDARGSLMEYLSGAASQDLDRRMALRQALIQALQNAFATWVNRPRAPRAAAPGAGSPLSVPRSWGEGGYETPGGFDPDVWRKMFGGG